jgi:hypothetical protein
VINLGVYSLSIAASFLFGFLVLSTRRDDGHDNDRRKTVSMLLAAELTVYVFTVILLVSILEGDGVATSKFDISLSVRYHQVRVPIVKTNQKLQAIEQSTNLTYDLSLSSIATMYSCRSFLS